MGLLQIIHFFFFFFFAPPGHGTGREPAQIIHLLYRYNNDEKNKQMLRRCKRTQETTIRMEFFQNVVNHHTMC
jgi:hypothetical protein